MGSSNLSITRNRPQINSQFLFKYTIVLQIFCQLSWRNYYNLIKYQQNKCFALTHISSFYPLTILWTEWITLWIIAFSALFFSFFMWTNHGFFHFPEEKLGFVPNFPNYFVTFYKNGILQKYCLIFKFSDIFCSFEYNDTTS